MAIALIILGLIALVVGIQGMRNWYKENAAGGVTPRTNLMMMGGFFGGTVGLLLGVCLLILS